MTTFEQRRADLGARLRELREQAGLDGKQFSEHTGMKRPKVTKLELGQQTPTDEDLETYLDGLQVPADVANALRADLAALAEEYTTWKKRLKAGHRAVQEEAITREANAAVIRAVDVGIVPGFLQTPDYARHALTAVSTLHGTKPDIEEGVRARMRRQAVLYEGGKRLELLVGYSAFDHPICPPDVMAGQIHRLLATIGTPGVRFGVIRPYVQLPYPLTHGFWIVDDLVMIEELHGEVTVYDPDQVAKYNRLTDMLWTPEITAEGDEASALLFEVFQHFGTPAHS